MTPKEKKTAVVICPGRGTYLRENLGYLKEHHEDKRKFITQMDDYRIAQNQTPVSELDCASVFRMSTHSTGDNASALIYTCAMADFLSIDQNTYDIVAITGNSMGWYLALAASGACTLADGMHITNTMGTLMHREAEGAQLIFPLCNEHWQYDPKLKHALQEKMNHASQQYQIFASIDLGLMAVIAGDIGAIEYLMQALPKVQQRYPVILPNHAAFHTPLMRRISALGKNTLAKNLISAPKIPLIDGLGCIWQPHSTNSNNLYEYTFDDQVCKTYNYSKAIEVACKEFAPDYLIILGPGSSLGPPTAQQLIKMAWHNIVDKASFKARQAENPFILSMGIEAQRAPVTAHSAITNKEHTGI